MKHLLAAIALSTTFAALAQDATIIAANATLKDNSTLKGELTTKQITGSTLFLEKLELDPALIKSIAFKGTNGESKVELANGDKFAMTVANENFAIKSMLGELAIPRENFRSIALSARKSSAGSTDGGLIFHCTFDDEASIKTPAVGPEGTICSRQFVDGKVNKAVRVPDGGSAGFFSLPAEALGKEGCIEFWAKLEPRSECYRDCDPRIVFIKSPAGWLTIEYTANNGAGKGGFFIRCFGHEAIKGGYSGMRYKFADIVKDVFGWHHYAVSWTETTVKVFVDGNIPDGMHQSNNVRIDAEKFKLGPAVIGLPNDNINPYNTTPNTPFVIDEFKVWDYAKDSFDL